MLKSALTSKPCHMIDKITVPHLKVISTYNYISLPSWHCRPGLCWGLQRDRAKESLRDNVWRHSILPYQIIRICQYGIYERAPCLTKWMTLTNEIINWWQKEYSFCTAFIKAREHTFIALVSANRSTVCLRFPISAPTSRIACYLFLLSSRTRSTRRRKLDIMWFSCFRSHQVSVFQPAVMSPMTIRLEAMSFLHLLRPWPGSSPRRPRISIYDAIDY